ncbi:hypothetical protein ACQ4PT_010105 [Festuca glaucescens]
MAPRSKQCTKRAPGTEESAGKAKISGWERSKLSAQDQKLLKKMGLLNKEAIKMPGDESSPHPPIGFRVTFVDFLIRGLAVPVHEFLRGLLFIYGIQLHQLTPNSLLHISIFITLCECFLGIHPHWGLWKRIFYLRRNNSKNVAYNPLQARKNPLWMYTGAEDVDRISDDLSVKDLEKLVWRFTSLNKNHEVPSSCRVEPFSGSHALPKNHQTLSSLPPLPEGGEVDDRVVVADDSQESPLPESEPAGSQRSAGSSDKDTESDSAHSDSPPPAISPDGRKRKRNDDEDSGASKLAEPAAEESSPEDQEFFDPFAKTGAVSSADEGEESEEPEAHGPAPTSTSNTLVLSEECRVASETSPLPQHNSEAPTPMPSPRALKKKKAKTEAASTQELAAGSTSGPLLDDPLMKELVNLGSQFIGFRDEATALRDALRRAEERADDLEAKLKASEAARKKAEKDAVAAEGKMGEQYNLSQELDDCLLDTLDILELNCDLARKCITSARNALKRVFPHFFPKETQPEIFSQLAHHFLAKDDPALAYRQASLKIGVEGTIALVAASDQKIDWVKTAAPKGLNSRKWKALVKDAKLYSKKLITFLDPKSSASASAAQTEVK